MLFANRCSICLAYLILDNIQIRTILRKYTPVSFYFYGMTSGNSSVQNRNILSPGGHYMITGVWDRTQTPRRCHNSYEYIFLYEFIAHPKFLILQYISTISFDCIHLRDEQVGSIVPCMIFLIDPAQSSISTDTSISLGQRASKYNGYRKERRVSKRACH